MTRPEGLLRGSFLVLDIDPRLDLSFFRDGRCRCQAQRDMIADNMEKEITITPFTVSAWLPEPCPLGRTSVRFPSPGRIREYVP